MLANTANIAPADCTICNGPITQDRQLSKSSVRQERLLSSQKWGLFSPTSLLNCLRVFWHFWVFWGIVTFSEDWGLLSNGFPDKPLRNPLRTHSNGAFPLHGTAWYSSLLGGFPLGAVPGTWYFFSTTSAGVPSDPYRYQNVMCKLCWSLIGQRKSSLLHHWTCDMRPIYPLDLNQHSQRRSGRSFCFNKHTFLYQPQNSSIVVCWGSSDVPLVDSRGADPARAWWRDAEGKSLVYILLNLLYFQSMSSVYIFTFVSVFCFN